MNTIVVPYTQVREAFTMIEEQDFTKPVKIGQMVFQRELIQAEDKDINCKYEWWIAVDTHKRVISSDTIVTKPYYN